MAKNLFRHQKRWIVAVVVTAAVFVLAYLWAWGGSGPWVLAEDLGALNSLTEIALGINVAYLGFDRFRFMRRFRETWASFSVEHATAKDIMRSALGDNELTRDEKNILAVYLLADDEAAKDAEFTAFLKKNPAAFRGNEFEASGTGMCISALLTHRTDRVAVITTTAWVMTWASASAFMQMGAAWRYIDLPSDRILLVAGLLIAFCCAVPVVVFLTSEFAFWRVRRLLGTWFQSHAAAIKRNVPREPPDEAVRMVESRR